MKKLEEFKLLADDIKIDIDNKVIELERSRQKMIELEMFSKYDEDQLNVFFKKPYTIIPKREGEWYLVVPKIFDLNVGYLFKSDDSFNIFIVNKYADYLGDIPSEFKKIFKFKPKLPLKVEGNTLFTGRDNQAIAWERYVKFLTRREGKDKIKIKRGREFDLMAKLIDDGILPFIPKPVQEKHIIEKDWKKMIPEFEKRINMDFYKEAVDRFIQTGAIGVYWAMGVGKTIFGLDILNRIKVIDEGVVLPNLVISGNSSSLRQQWEDKIYEFISPSTNIEIVTMSSLHKVKGKKYGVMIIDEAHHLPANTYSKASLVDCEYRVGLSATPYREDQRTEYIFALTGFPVGLNWKDLIDLDLIKEPKITLFLCRDYNTKKKKIKELVNDDKKTLIYSFGISQGKSLSREIDCPFVYGATSMKDRLNIIKNNHVCIVSSVGTEGISIQDLERTITYDFHFGSRREETQFMGRVLHGTSEDSEHIILMTDEEFERYGKRIYGIQEKGFKIRMVRI